MRRPPQVFATGYPHGAKSIAVVMGPGRARRGTGSWPKPFASATAASPPPPIALKPRSTATPLRPLLPPEVRGLERLSPRQGSRPSAAATADARPGGTALAWSWASLRSAKANPQGGSGRSSRPPARPHPGGPFPEHLGQGVAHVGPGQAGHINRRRRTRPPRTAPDQAGRPGPGHRRPSRAGMDPDERSSPHSRGGPPSAAEPRPPRWRPHPGTAAATPAHHAPTTPGSHSGRPIRNGPGSARRPA